MSGKIACTNILLFILLAIACRRDDFNWGTRVGDLTYSGNVIFLGAEELNLLTAIDGTRLTFSSNGGTIGDISAGSILVMGVSGLTPYGLMRKVTGITPHGPGVIISTTSAELTEVIKEGTIRFRRKLLEEDFTLKSKSDNVILGTPGKSFDGLAVTLDNFPLITGGAGSAFLNGGTGISPELGISVNFAFNEIKEMEFYTNLYKIDEVTVSSDGVITGGNEETVAEFIHSPIIIDSLVFVAEVRINLGFEGTAASPVTSGVRQDRQIVSGMKFKDSRWTEDPVTHTEAHDFIKPLVSNNAGLKIFSGPEIVIRLFGVPIQVVRTSVYYSLQAGAGAPSSWKILIGNNGQNTVKADLFGLNGDHSLDMAAPESEIGNSGSK